MKVRTETKRNKSYCSNLLKFDTLRRNLDENSAISKRGPDLSQMYRIIATDVTKPTEFCRKSPPKHRSAHVLYAITRAHWLVYWCTQSGRCCQRIIGKTRKLSPPAVNTTPTRVVSLPAEKSRQSALAEPATRGHLRPPNYPWPNCSIQGEQGSTPLRGGYAVEPPHDAPVAD